MPLAPLGTPYPEETFGRDAGTANDRRPWQRRPRPSPEARRPLLTAMGALIVVGCALLGAEVAGQVNHRSTYLGLATYVPQGSVITASDLTVVSLTAGSGLAAIPASDERSVIGRRASEPLDPGSLLVPDDVTAVLPLPIGDALVGSSLAGNQFPAGLVPGDSVIVVLAGPATGLPASSAGSGSLGTAPASSGTGGSGTPGTGTGGSGTSGTGTGGSGISGTGTAASGVLTVGTVYDITLPSASDPAASSGDETVTLEVPEAVAAEVTSASAASEVSLAEISTRPGP